MLPQGEPPAVEPPRPRPPGLDSVLTFFAARAEPSLFVTAAWGEIEKIPGVVWFGNGPRAFETLFERQGVGVLWGVGAVEMTARGVRTGVAEIDVLVTSPYVEDAGTEPPTAGFAAETTVERLSRTAGGCTDAFRATLPGRSSVYLMLRKATAGTVIAFRREPPACS